MSQEMLTIKNLIKGLEKIVGSEKVLRDSELLDKFSSDTSINSGRRPDVVVKVLSTDEVQKVVKFAHEHSIPVTPKSSGIGFYGAGIPQQGGIVIDMSDMKKVRRVDARNKWVLIEPGVTYGQLQEELAKHGFRALNPLLPHKEKSVITSILEREPRLTPKHHLDETILTMELVFPNGDLFRTGSMAMPGETPEKVQDETHTELCNAMGPGIDWYRLIPGSLGTYGIVTAMNIKITPLPQTKKFFFIAFKSLEDAIEPFYKIERKQIGDECFLLNNIYLASVLADSPEEIPAVASVLSPYTLILNITAGEWFPEEKIKYQEEALQEIANIYLFNPMESLPGIKEAEKILARQLYQPWDSERYWKFKSRGASQEIFFLTTLQRSPQFLEITKRVAAENGYPPAQIGLYLQPKQWGKAFHMEMSLPYNPEDTLEREKIERVYLQASNELVNKGAFFYRPYGAWAEMVFSRTGNLHEMLKQIKRILDPKSILNPGKLGF